jgi:hypothetical protein
MLVFGLVGYASAISSDDRWTLGLLAGPYLVSMGLCCLVPYAQFVRLSRHGLTVYLAIGRRRLAWHEVERFELQATSMGRERIMARTATGRVKALHRMLNQLDPRAMVEVLELWRGSAQGMAVDTHEPRGHRRPQAAALSGVAGAVTVAAIAAAHLYG